MMSAGPNSTDTIHVTLVRPGVGPQEFSLAQGATVGDLIREAKADVHHQVIMVGPRALEEAEVLTPDSFIFIVPRPDNAYSDVADEVLRTAEISEDELRREVALVL